MIDSDDGWRFDASYGQPIMKDGCGVLGIIRKPNAPQISSKSAVHGLSCIKYRGSNLGAGYACFDSTDRNKIRIRAFVKDGVVAGIIEKELSNLLGDPVLSEIKNFGGNISSSKILELEFDYSSIGQSKLDRKVDQINSILLSDKKIDGRIFSYGRSVSVFKEVGYPLDVAKMFGLDRENEKFGDLWLAHTRQPTNSPGSSPIWSHPFSSFDCAIVHNGDISSFGANLEFLKSLGYTSFAGTDSEVIADLLNYLIRVESLSVIEAATVLSNPFEERMQKSALDLLTKYKGAKLDGPFAVVAGYVDDSDSYLIALTDRSKFRPMVLGEDENCYYVASEENQIRILSPQARIWTPEPGSFFIASTKMGLIKSGTARIDSDSSWSGPAEVDSPESIDTTNMPFVEINEKILKSHESGSKKIHFANLSGQRYIGIGFSRGKRDYPFEIRLSGFPGNCLANLNDGATFQVFGNVGDDLGDTMHSGRILIHGSARDVVAQALQGGEIFVRRSVGNRAAIQMREYKNHRPFLIVGETADDYLCEYMAGGVVMVLNLSNQDNPVGNYVGTGMVGGTIYIKGKVKEQRIGLPPKKADILNYLKVEKIDGAISSDTFDAVSELEYPSEGALSVLLPDNIYKRVRNLFFRGKYSKPISSEYRKLNSRQDDLETLSKKIEDFFTAFGISTVNQEVLLDSEFTVIRTIEDEEKETPIPPQEIPVEE